MTKNDKNLPKMAKNDQKWPKMAKNGLKWPNMDKNGQMSQLQKLAVHDWFLDIFQSITDSNVFFNL